MTVNPVNDQQQQHLKDRTLLNTMAKVWAAAPVGTVRVEIGWDELQRLLVLAEQGLMAAPQLAQKASEYMGIRLSFVALVDAVGGEVTVQHHNLVEAQLQDLVMTESKADKSWTYRTKASAGRLVKAMQNIPATPEQVGQLIAQVANMPTDDAGRVPWGQDMRVDKPVLLAALREYLASLQTL